MPRIAPRQPARPARPGPAGPPAETADRLHSAAIHLLRSLRAEDRKSGLSGPRLSALSVIVFAGPLPMSALAAAEQVRPPTMTRLVRGLIRAGLVKRTRDSADRRVLRVAATARGRQLLLLGRRRRVARLAAALVQLPAADRRLLARAAALIEWVARPAPRPPGGTPRPAPGLPRR